MTKYTAKGGVTEMTTTQWIDRLVGLADTEQPLLRAAQIALAAIDELLVRDVVDDDIGIVAAYEALCAAIPSSRE